MKQYRPYRVVLFIALLGFTTLSACVHTRQELGWCLRLSNFEESSDTPSASTNFHIKPAVVKAGIGVGIVALGSLASYVLYHVFTELFNVVDPDLHNDIMPFNVTTERPNGVSVSPNMVSLNINQTAAAVAQAIEKGSQAWGDGNGIESLSSPAATEGTITMQSTSARQQLSRTTTAEPGDGVPPVRDPMKIDDEIIGHLKAHKWCKRSLLPLLAKGLDINAKDERGMTLLMKAAVRPDKDGASVKFLIEQGADVNQQDNTGDTVFHMLSRRGWVDIIALFSPVKEKINPNLQDNHQSTALHEAAKGCFKKTIEWLLQIKGIDLNIKDKDGKTPLDLVRKKRAKKKDPTDCDAIQKRLNRYNEQ